jgi:tRNA nucleotidyltransferase (CCA-adding enzyme)
MAKTENENIKRLISRYFTQLKRVKILTTGNDLMAMGFEAGKEFKEIFLKVLNEKLDGKLNTKEHEVTFIRNLK